jgi:hypothetical protein
MVRGCVHAWHYANIVVLAGPLWVHAKHGNMPFSKDTAAAAGRMGGMRRTAAKQEAARANGLKHEAETKPVKKAESDRPVKDYIVVGYQDEQGYPRKKKKYFRNLPNFNIVAMQFKHNPKMTARDVESWGGGAYLELGEKVLRYLRSLQQ